MNDQRRVALEDDFRIRILARQLLQRFALRQRDSRLPLTIGVRNRIGPFLKTARVGGGRSIGDRAGDRRALAQVQLRLLPDLGLLDEAATPALQVIDPGHHGVQVAPEHFDDEFRTPPVIAEGGHGSALPFGGALMAVEEGDRYRIMAVGKDVSLDLHRFADDTLGGETAAIDLRCDIFDDDANLAHRTDLR